MTRRLHVLLVDDDQWVCEMVTMLVKKAFPQVQLTIANNGEAGLEAFKRGGADVIISNNRMPLMTGPEMIAAIRATGIKTPVISISSAPSSQVDAFEAGANAFVDKGRLKELPETILRLLQAKDDTSGFAGTATASA